MDEGRQQTQRVLGIDLLELLEARRLGDARVVDDVVPQGFAGILGTEGVEGRAHLLGIVVVDLHVAYALTLEALQLGASAYGYPELVASCPRLAQHVAADEARGARDQ